MSTLRLPGQDLLNLGLQNLQSGSPLAQIKNVAQPSQQQQQQPPLGDEQMIQALLKAIMRILEAGQQNGNPEGQENPQGMQPQGFQMPQQAMPMPMPAMGGQPGVQGQGGQAQPDAPGSKSGVPGAPAGIPNRDDQPTDKSKTVDDYLKANNGLLGKLGNQEGVKDELKARYGDWDNKNRSPEERAQSAYNASRHVGTIKNKNNRDGEERSSEVTGNGKMEGATKSGDIRDGTEMGDLKNSLLGGRSNDEWHSQHKAGKIEVDAKKQDQSTKDVLSNPNLKPTKDTHVNKDGTNKDNFQWFCGEAAKKLWFIPGVSNVLKGVGDSKGGFLGVLKGAAGGVVETWKNDVMGVINGLKKGKLSPMQMLGSMYQENIKNSKTAPDAAKDVAKNLPF